MIGPVRRLVAEARIHAPGELAQLPGTGTAFALFLLAWAIAWVMLP